jgi:TorA maturation chaperone TorD
VPYESQAKFFEQHIATWMMAFFKDLESAKSARFYRVVGSLGSCFLESEREYLKCSAKDSTLYKRRRNRR